MATNIPVLDAEDFAELMHSISSIKHDLKKLSENNCKKIYTEKEVQNLLKVSAKTLQNYRSSGKIGFIKIDQGRKIFYRDSHIEEFLSKNEFKAFK